MVLQKRSPAIGRLGAFDEGTQVEVCPIFVKRFTSIYTVFTTVYFFLHRFTLIYPAPGRLSKLSFRHDHLHGAFPSCLGSSVGSILWHHYRLPLVHETPSLGVSSYNGWLGWWYMMIMSCTYHVFIYMFILRNRHHVLWDVFGPKTESSGFILRPRFSQGEIHHLSAVHKSKKSGILFALRRFCIANPAMFFGSLNSASFSSLRCSWFRGCSSIQGIGPSSWEIASNLKRDLFGLFFPCNLAVPCSIHWISGKLILGEMSQIW